MPRLPSPQENKLAYLQALYKSFRSQYKNTLPPNVESALNTLYQWSKLPNIPIAERIDALSLANQFFEDRNSQTPNPKFAQSVLKKAKEIDNTKSTAERIGDEQKKLNDFLSGRRKGSALSETVLDSARKSLNIIYSRSKYLLISPEEKLAALEIANAFFETDGNPDLLEHMKNQADSLKDHNTVLGSAMKYICECIVVGCYNLGVAAYKQLAKMTSDKPPMTPSRPSTSGPGVSYNSLRSNEETQSTSEKQTAENADSSEDKFEI